MGVILAAADGSSLANPGPSGWAWYIDDSHWAAGGWAKGTNNMGELMSVLDLLRATRAVEEPLRIICDSQYAINCCTRWIPAWKKRGWRKADNKPVLNLDLLTQLDEELAGRRIGFQWVKGHMGHPLNEKADQLARAAATAYQQGTPVQMGPGYSKAAVLERLEIDESETGASYVFSIPEIPDSPSQDCSPLLGLDLPRGGHDPALDPQARPPVMVHLEPPTPTVVDLTELTREFFSDDIGLDRERLAEVMHPRYVAHLPEGLIRTKGSVLARPAVLEGSVQLDIQGADHFGDDLVLLRFKMRRNSQDFLGALLWQLDDHWQARFLQLTAISPRS